MQFTKLQGEGSDYTHDLMVCRVLLHLRGTGFFGSLVGHAVVCYPSAMQENHA